VSDPGRIVIAGAGFAGAKAAEGLREEGFEGELVLLGAEGELPYERPPLSKGYLRGEEAKEAAQVHPADYYREAGIDLRTDASVASIDAGARRVVLEAGGEIGFDRLLLATGATPRELPLPGIDLAGVHQLRSIRQADALARELRPGARLAIVGGGWIGAEVAASARQRGAEVDVLERGSVMLGSVLGERLGSLFEDLHGANGVRVHPRTAVEGFEGDGRVERVRLAGGETIDCDLALVAVGAVPATGLAEAAGIEVADGILVDERLATSAPGVFAAGDVANAWRPFYGRRLRVEHWANALHQGPAAALNMLGRPMAYAELPYFFSDQYDVGMEYSGFAPAWDRVVFRGDPSGREFIAFWLAGDRVLAGMNLNVWDVNETIQRIIRRGSAIDIDRLADLDVPLEALAPDDESKAA
jgi:3-phenylpropionate/trans-cinnamate dioxygenase ferredoxin reductase subunit